MTSISVTDDSTSKIRKMLQDARRKAPIQSKKTSRQMAKDLVVIVKQNASGRPGPEVQTGAYKNSIRVFGAKDDPTSSTTYAGTDAPEANRLENGYVGTDSLGRHYHQPPFPHWRPGIRALGVSKKKYAAILREALPQ